MTKAFDSALFIPANPNAGEVVEIASPGPPLKTQFGNYIAGPPGVSVEASVPAATAQGQVAPVWAWAGLRLDAGRVVFDPAAADRAGPDLRVWADTPFPMQLAPAVPQPPTAMQTLYSGPRPGAAGFAWTPIANLLSLGGALTIAGGTIVRGGALLFTPVLDRNEHRARRRRSDQEHR